MFKNIALIALLTTGTMADMNFRMNLRAGGAEVAESTDSYFTAEKEEHLDLELMQDGERKLFPLLPGTKCPTGHTCRVRTFTNTAESPMISSLKKNFKTPLSMAMEWKDMGDNLDTVVRSNDYCTRRNAMARAAGLAAGVAAATVSQPAYAAQTAEVKMGDDSGLLVFVPAKTSICSGDSVKWINNKAGPHNVVFDEDAIPSGVDVDAISMDDQLAQPGDSFSMKFSTAGTYEYFCEPHRGAGMAAVLTVT